MAAKAGEAFICACCATPHPESDAKVDNQLGPVCPDCVTQIRWATAWLKKADIIRPVNIEDLYCHQTKNRLAQ